MKKLPKHYHRYHIETKKALNVLQHPHRFKVKVKKLGLAKLLLKEMVHYRGNWDVILSRPCIYGVFSGPLGGFAPREKLCVGCLRCTTEYPGMVDISPNPERTKLGDSYFTRDFIDNVVYEAESGRVPVKGQGYRGKFGGPGWEGMWTDMSEIVRPTRDGIHGREFISTEIDIGEKPPFLHLDAGMMPSGDLPKTVTLPLPILFDRLTPGAMANETCCRILVEAARQIQSYAIIPLRVLLKFSVKGSYVIPLIAPLDITALKTLTFTPSMIELESWSVSAFNELRSLFPQALLILRSPYETGQIMEAYAAGVRIFHLAADYHGRGRDGKFVLELIREIHLLFVSKGCRDEVTLLGSGGIIAAEHVPKAIICGLDGIALDTPLMVALQARFKGPCVNYENSHFELPAAMKFEWGWQRLKNLAGSWRDQLLEILGAMGLREVRRLRGEIGRAMFQKDLENEAFEGITGYASQ